LLGAPHAERIALDDFDAAGRDSIEWLSISASSMLVTVGTRWSSGRTTTIPVWLSGG